MLQGCESSKPRFSRYGKTWLHLTVTSGVAGYLLLLGKGENVGSRKTAVPIVVAIPALTALHALYFDRHWATDIIGGWLAGAAIASGCAYGYEIAQARKKAPRVKRKPR